MVGTNSEVPADVDYVIPSWASKAPAGTHLDVYKGEKLLQKLMIDEKRCYFFGRNPQLCDIAVEHASCSRVHAALVFHKHLNRFFLTDLGSAHGTYISNVLLEGNKAEQLQTDQIFRFGASTRRYILREKPSSKFYRDATDGLDDKSVSVDKHQPHFLNLPMKEEELENLTEYNTALNRRISALNVTEESFHNAKRRKKGNINFNDEDDIINPEDVDPSVGKFRNLVQTAVISTKRPRLDLESSSHHRLTSSISSFSSTATARPASPTSGQTSGMGTMLTNLGSKLGINLSLNIAPDVELYPATMHPPSNASQALMPSRKVVETGVHVHVDHEGDDAFPKKKKYAKEAWPGKKPALLI